MGMFAVPEREGQTEEDILQEIFEMQLQGSTRRYPSGYLRLDPCQQDTFTPRKPDAYPSQNSRDPVR